MANKVDLTPADDSQLSILSARIADRASLLAASEDAAKLVPRMPPEELLFTLRAANRDDALAVLEHARPSQVRFLLDMEIWRGEEVDPSRAAEWLTLLDDCGQKPLGRWLTALELPDLAALCGKIARASFANEAGMSDRDDTEGENSFTLDGVHFVRVASDLAPRFQRLLMLLRLSDKLKHDRLIEILFTGFDVEDEEVADRFRRARLAERGFPDLAEAQHIYATLEPTALKAQPPRIDDEDAPPPSVLPPAYPVALTGGPSAGGLVRALDRLARTTHGPALLSQLARLTNLVVSADAMDTGDLDSFALAARKVAGRLSIALETLHPKDEAAYDETLSMRYLEHLFRVGNTRVRKAQELARRFLRDGWPKGNKKALTLLGEPLAEAVRALAHPLPMVAVQTPEGFFKRDFDELADLVEAERLLAKAALAGRFAKDALGVDPADPALIGRETDFGELFLTAVANAAIGKGLIAEPLSPEDAKAALAVVLETRDGQRRVAHARLAAALDSGGAVMRVNEDEAALVGEFFAEALSRLEEEFGRLPEGDAPDPRYFKGLLLKPD